METFLSRKLITEPIVFLGPVYT